MPVGREGNIATGSCDCATVQRGVAKNKTSRAARIQGGIRVPAMENELKSYGLTLRHFPQSMELATLGGMIATRSGGHFATLYTHIDDLVESLRTISPAGITESRRLPGSGAGPSPDRLMIGSEGSFGIITEAWMRLQARPTFRAGTAVLFDDVFKAAKVAQASGQTQCGLARPRHRCLAKRTSTSRQSPLNRSKMTLSSPHGR